MGPSEEVADGDDVIPGQCLRLVPALPWHAWLGPSQPGVKPREKPKGARSVRGHRRGEWPGGVNASECLLMPREENIPGWAAVPG